MQYPSSEYILLHKHPIDRTRFRMRFCKIHTSEIDVDHCCLGVRVSEEPLETKWIASVLDEVNFVLQPFPADRILATRT